VSLAQTGTAGVEDVRARLAACGQGHVLRFWDVLDGAQRARLLAQEADLELDTLARHRARALALAAALQERVAPAPVERLPERGGDEAAWARARAAGEVLLAEGRVAALVLAGGQGTRLGHPGPKGAFPLGPVSGRTLFGLQAQRLRRLARRHGRPVPWYVMTSAATDAATRACFAREGCFGLDPADVIFFRQAEMPVLDPEGRLLLAAPDRIATAPDGHGGAIPALARTGALRDAEERGIEVLFSYQVDNPLARIGDPLLLGFHALRGAEMTSKVVRKRAPDERVGTLVQRDGSLAVVEYTELREPHRSSRNDAGELAFWAGAIGIHALDRRFVARVAEAAEEALPYHLSPKRVTTIDARGERLVPAEHNAVKLERFVFDALPRAAMALAVEVRREEEYSPIKNAEGSESPASARRDLVACVRRWLEAAGIALPAEGVPIEVDHALIDASDDARALGVRCAEDVPHVILTGTGGLG
jgi:UDP-N-acetylglucosamine/UDP-N-acetylgalactosamine diphosphorylase